MRTRSKPTSTTAGCRGRSMVMCRSSARRSSCTKTRRASPARRSRVASSRKMTRPRPSGAIDRRSALLADQRDAFCFRAALLEARRVRDAFAVIAFRTALLLDLGRKQLRAARARLLRNLGDRLLRPRVDRAALRQLGATARDGRELFLHAGVVVLAHVLDLLALGRARTTLLLHRRDQQ